MLYIHLKKDYSLHALDCGTWISRWSRFHTLSHDMTQQCLSHAFSRSFIIQCVQSLSSLNYVYLVILNIKQSAPREDWGIHTAAWLSWLRTVRQIVLHWMLVFYADNPAQRRLETFTCLPRVSHIWTWTSRSAFLSPTHHSYLACIFFTGEGTHSPQSGYVQPSPTTAPHRLSDLSTFSNILGSHKPFSTLLWSFPGWAAASSGLNGTRPNLASAEKEKKTTTAIWMWATLTAANSHMEVFWDRFILQNRCSYI